MERERPTPDNAEIPEPLPVRFEGIPERLGRFDHFVVWQYERFDDELKKPPFDPKTGKRASVGRSDTWGSFAQAQAAYATGEFAGVGIVLTQQMGIVGIDIDHCVQDGQISEETQQIISAINSYTEVSPSGAGIRMFTEAKLPGAFRRREKIELYEDARYLTITGHHLPTTPREITTRHAELYRVYQRLFPQQRQRENTVGGVAHRASLLQPVSRSDGAVLQKALAAKNGENFKRYYHGDSSLWEGADAKHRSQSEADFTLVLLLLYWTNGDTTQVERLFRQSGLMREKWDRSIKGSETYGERIIHDAIRKGR